MGVPGGGGGGGSEGQYSGQYGQTKGNIRAKQLGKQSQSGNIRFTVGQY